MDEVSELCRKVGAWASDGEAGKGAIILGSAGLALLLGGYRWLRRPPPPAAPPKTTVTVVASQGESVRVRINGEDS